MKTSSIPWMPQKQSGNPEDLENLNVTTCDRKKSPSTPVSNLTTSYQATSTIATATPAPGQILDWKLILAIVLFSVGAFIILIAIILLVVYIVRRKHRKRMKLEAKRRAANLNEYHLKGNGINTGIPLPATTYDRPAMQTTSFTTPATPTDLDAAYYYSSSPQSNDSIDGELSNTESHQAAVLDNFVRLHRASPLAGINEIYGEIGRANSLRGANRQLVHDRNDILGSRAGYNGLSRDRAAGSSGRTKRLTNGDLRTKQGVVNEGFVIDDIQYRLTHVPSVTSLHSPSVTSYPLPNAPSQYMPRPSSNQVPNMTSQGLNKTPKSNGNVLVHNAEMHDGIYYVGRQQRTAHSPQTAFIGRSNYVLKANPGYGPVVGGAMNGARPQRNGFIPNGVTRH